MFHIILSLIKIDIKYNLVIYMFRYRLFLYSSISFDLSIAHFLLKVKYAIFL
uniref:Uncharacterized protein n=1 Tax=Ackermannviridae sp. ctaCq7 TaxID=2827294 RepID=A0A8S5R653_9CAUD|nr:MAG TPA: hypothetical protein [Ackermannviridae sp. ctaCq7]